MAKIFSREISKEDKRFLMSHGWQKSSHYRRNAGLFFSILVSSMAVYLAFANYHLSRNTSLIDNIFFLVISMIWIGLIAALGGSSYSDFKASKHYREMYNDYLQSYFDELGDEIIDDYKKEGKFF
jgi:hypothetical protein